MLNFDLIIQYEPHCEQPHYRWNLCAQDNSSAVLLKGQFTKKDLEFDCTKDSRFSLERLIKTFKHPREDAWRSFDEAAQLQLGHHLYHLLFSDAPKTLFPADEDVLLRVVSEDAFISHGLRLKPSPLGEQIYLR